MDDCGDGGVVVVMYECAVNRVVALFEVASGKNWESLANGFTASCVGERSAGVGLRDYVGVRARFR